MMSLWLLALTFSFTSLAEKELACSDQRICEIANAAQVLNNGVIPDRKSHGLTIRGGKPSTFATFHHSCKEGNCRFKDRGRMRRLLADAQKRIIKIFLNGREESQLSAAELNILNRYRSARFADPADGGVCESYCVANGVAEAGIRTLGPCVCPVVEQFTDEAILQLYAHEVAHFGDGCQILRDQWTEKGTLKALRFEDHPFAQKGGLNQCLASNGIPMGWYSEKSPQQQYDKFLKDQVTATLGKTMGEILYEPIRTIATLVPPKELQHTECFGRLGGSQMAEAQCDHMAWEVVGDFLKDHPFDSQDPYAGARAFSTFTFGCSSSHSGVLQAHNGLFVAHPSERDRMAKIALNVPAIRQALGCQSPAKTCEIGRDTSKPATSSWSSDVKPADPNANR